MVPLSVLDDHSRYLLALRPGTNPTYATVQAVLRDLLGDVDLPEQLLCDNAFSARNTAVGLSAFDAWLIRLGIRPAHGRPYHPQTQGKVERFHGTLERELWPQVRRDRLDDFEADSERWRPVSNSTRPYEALGDEPPVCRWRPSPRPRPAELPEVSYAGDAITRVVGQTGDVRWHRRRLLIGAGLVGQRVEVRDRGHEVEVFSRTH